jgi:hypothetical protein
MEQNIFSSVAPASSLAFVFIGNGAQVTLLPGQTVTAVLTATLGSTGTATQVGVTPVYQLAAGGPVTSFSPGNYNTIASLSAKTIITVSGTLKVIPSDATLNAGEIRAGTYKIGLGIRNTSSTAINNNDVLNGFIMVQ